MIAKRHEIDQRVILAVCDKECLGKTFEQGELQFVASVKFYSGEDVTEDELIEMFKSADSINLFGNKCVEIALKKGLVSEKSIITIAGQKHAQVYRT